MSPHNLRIQIRAMAVLAQVEGMKAQNELRLVQGEYPEYSFSDFDTYVDMLNTLSLEVIDD